MCPGLMTVWSVRNVVGTLGGRVGLLKGSWFKE